MLVDDDEAAPVGRHPGSLQAQVDGARYPAGRDQQPGPARALPGPGAHHDLPAGVLDRGGAVADQGDPVVGEHRTQHLGELGLGRRGRPADQGDPRPEVGEQLCLLHPDVAAADHDQRFGHLGLFHRRGRGQPVAVVQAGQGRAGRFRAGRDQVGASRQRRPVDGERVGPGEPGVPGSDVEPVGIGDGGVLALAQPADQLVLLFDQPGQIHLQHRGRAPENGLASAPCRAPAAASSVLDGTQPTFTQVPPRVACSMSVTVRPACRAAMAAAIAAPPEPMTARSTGSESFMSASRSRPAGRIATASNMAFARAVDGRPRATSARRRPRAGSVAGMLSSGLQWRSGTVVRLWPGGSATSFRSAARRRRQRVRSGSVPVASARERRGRAGDRVVRRQLDADSGWARSGTRNATSSPTAVLRRLASMRPTGGASRCSGPRGRAWCACDQPASSGSARERLKARRRRRARSSTSPAPDRRDCLIAW